MRRFLWLALTMGLLCPLACKDGGSESEIHYETGLEERGHIHVLRLAGTPYEMGLQSGELMTDALADGVDFLYSDPLFSAFVPLARSQGFLDDAQNQSYPYVLDECRGMAEAARRAGVDWTEDECLGLAWGDVLLEHLESMMGACSQIVVSGPGTVADTHLHIRSLDWGDISYLFQHPTVIVRRPEGKIPYVTIGFPGMVAPYSGINDAGLSVASNENVAIDDIDRVGSSHVQMVGYILQNFRSLEEAEAFIRAQDHCTAESLMVSDAVAGKAAVFEMSANHLAVRYLSDDGVVYMTNHFVEESMDGLHIEYAPEDSSPARFARMRELVEPDGVDSVFGELGPEVAIEKILRDTTNPVTGVTHPLELFDGGGSIANNAAVYMMVFAPRERMFWVSMGAKPVAAQRFVGFHLDELFGIDPKAVAEPAFID